MFNLVATVLAVIVMVAVALAGLSYLGPAFGTAAARAAAAQVVNAGAQVQGAESLRRAENGGTALVDDPSGGPAVAGLVAEGYLKAVPATPRGLAAPGATWTYAVPPGGTRPVLALALDDSRGSLDAFCAEVSKVKGFGCADDLATVGAAQ